MPRAPTGLLASHFTLPPLLVPHCTTGVLLSPVGDGDTRCRGTVATSQAGRLVCDAGYDDKLVRVSEPGVVARAVADGTRAGGHGEGRRHTRRQSSLRRVTGSGEAGGACEYAKAKGCQSMSVVCGYSECAMELPKRSQLRCLACNDGTGAYYHLQCFFSCHRCLCLME